jgi:glycerophosphoryl diester phosphodiesterase
MPPGPHPESVIHTPDGREVQLKVHQCVWSGELPENSLPAILECYREHVARAEIDVAVLRDCDFLVVHDLNLANATDGSGPVAEISCVDSRRLHLTHQGAVTSERPPLLSDVVEAVAAEPFPTILELDLKDWNPWPWPRVEELARIVEPIKDRITFGGVADWNLRRLLHVDPTLPMGFTITQYLDWVPETTRPDAIPGVRGAYGYLDAHPLARQRNGPAADYLRDRLTGLLRLVPGIHDLHVRLLAVEQMLEDGFLEIADLVHAQGAMLDVWTLNADTPNWRQRLDRALALGADVVTSSTPRTLARAYLPADA